MAVFSLLLHHLDPGPAAAALRELRRVARRGIVVNDLTRTWAGLVGLALLLPLLARSWITRHDGLVSVRRAYTPPELRRLARSVGLDHLHSAGWLGARVALWAEVRA